MRDRLAEHGMTASMSRKGISEHTVHNHLSSLYHKLGLINRIELLVYALKHRLVEGEEHPDSGWVEVN